MSIVLRWIKHRNSKEEHHPKPPVYIHKQGRGQQVRYSILLAQCYRRNWEEVEFLCRQCPAELYYFSHFEEALGTVLHMATLPRSNGCPQRVLRTILDANLHAVLVKVYPRVGYGHTPLHNLLLDTNIYRDNVVIIKMFVDASQEAHRKYPQEVVAEDATFWSPLFMAARNGASAEILDILARNQGTKADWIAPWTGCESFIEIKQKCDAGCRVPVKSPLQALWMNSKLKNQNLVPSLTPQLRLQLRAVADFFIQNPKASITSRTRVLLNAEEAARAQQQDGSHAMQILDFWVKFLAIIRRQVKSESSLPIAIASLFHPIPGLFRMIRKIYGLEEQVLPTGFPISKLAPYHYWGPGSAIRGIINMYNNSWTVDMVKSQERCIRFLADEYAFDVLRHCDVASGLYPFCLAASKTKFSVDLIFHLLVQCPDALEMQRRVLGYDTIHEERRELKTDTDKVPLGDDNCL